MSKQHYTLSVIFILTVLLFTSCNNGNGGLIYEGELIYAGKGWCDEKENNKRVYLKNKSVEKKITFTVEVTKEPNDIYSIVQTLNPGERKEIGATCDGYGRGSVNYKIVGAFEEVSPL